MKMGLIDIAAPIGAAALGAMVVAACGDDIKITLQKGQIMEAAEDQAQKHAAIDHECGQSWQTVAGLRDVLDIDSVRENTLQTLGISPTRFYELANELRASLTADACFVNTIIDNGQRVETAWEVDQMTQGPWGCAQPDRSWVCNPFQPMFDAKALVPLDN
jgi:hypothetical protein